MSTEQMREAFNAWAVSAAPGEMIVAHGRKAFEAGYKAALNQPAAPAPKDAAPDIAAIRNTLMTGLSHNLAIAALDRIAAMEQERDDINRRCSEYMEAGNQQALRMAALEAQLAAQPVAVHYESNIDAQTRYRVEPSKGGFWPSVVLCGDGTRELFRGHTKVCEQVARELRTAFLDGEFVAAHGINAATQGEVKS